MVQILSAELEDWAFKLPPAEHVKISSEEIIFKQVHIMSLNLQNHILW